jgi:hypothetical protein
MQAVFSKTMSFLYLVSVHERVRARAHAHTHTHTHVCIQGVSGGNVNILGGNSIRNCEEKS